MSGLTWNRPVLQLYLHYCPVLQLYLEYQLKPTWDWLITIMDSTEAQLRFGSALSNTSDPASPSHPLHTSHSRAARDRSGREETRILQVVDSRRRRFGAIGTRSIVDSELLYKTFYLLVVKKGFSSICISYNEVDCYLMHFLTGHPLAVNFVHNIM